MRKVLQTNGSRSNPGLTYDIVRGKDGVVYCTCPGWCTSRKSPKMCRHLRSYLEENSVKSS